GWINQSLQAGLESCPLCRINLNLEYRELHALTIVLASLRDAAQTFGAARLRQAYIIGHQYHHRTSPISKTTADNPQDLHADGGPEVVPARRARDQEARSHREMDGAAPLSCAPAKRQGRSCGRCPTAVRRRHRASRSHRCATGAG